MTEAWGRCPEISAQVSGGVGWSHEDEVPDEVWNEWNTAWETLDKSHLGYLNCMHLKQSRR